MNTISANLAQTLLDHLPPKPKRLLVGIAGPPASGKSTLATSIVKHLNAGSGDELAILVGLDGWHLTRDQLDLMPDPVLAHARRGAHWTFDAPGYVSFVKSVQQPITTDIITAPSFDHALKDPIPGAIVIRPNHRIIIIEGLYAFLSKEPWEEAGKLLDIRWFIRVDPDEAYARLVERHVLTGVTKDATEASKRAQENDIPNGKFITENMLEPTMVIESVNDLSFIQ